MLTDLTALDPLGWEALKGALNQRVLIERIRFVPSRKNRVWIIETNVRPVVVRGSSPGSAKMNSSFF